MPELPDILVYVDALRSRLIDRPLRAARVLSPLLLRTVEPPLEACGERRVRDVGRIGKRIVLAMDDDLFLVIHLMIAGRLRWLKPGARPPGRIALAMLEFEGGTLAITEAGTRKRAALHVVRGAAALAPFDAGGLDLQLDEADYATRARRCALAELAPEFMAALRRENHTLKRALTDPHIVNGVGNAYSDEILHAARLSPLALTRSASDEQLARLFEAARATLGRWIATLREKFAGRFPGPGDITAFRPEFAVHGRFGLPCPVCGEKVQRIRYADSETNYCPTCQTGGRVLADRSLSRLLREDWPRTVEELGA